LSIHSIMNTVDAEMFQSGAAFLEESAKKLSQ